MLVCLVPFKKMISVGPYKHTKLPDRSGIYTKFQLKGRILTGTIYQNVTMKYKLNGSPMRTFRFSEAWAVTKKDKRRKIEQTGNDSFLVPYADVEGQGGSLMIDAVAWFETGKLDSRFKRKDDGMALYGNLKGMNGHKGVPADATVLKRRARASWKRGVAPTWKVS